MASPLADVLLRASAGAEPVRDNNPLRNAVVPLASYAQSQRDKGAFGRAAEMFGFENGQPKALGIRDFINAALMAVPAARMMPRSATVPRTGSMSAPTAIQKVDPASLIFREAEQGNLDYIREAYPKGGGYDPIVIAKTEEGPVIMDGHNRARVAIERGDKLPAVEIDGGVYEALKRKGWDETDMSHHFLESRGYTDAASGIRQKFPGVQFFKNDEMIAKDVADLLASR